MKIIGSVILLFAMALSAGSARTAGPEPQNLTRLREEIRVLESVLNENLNQTFPAPFAYLDKARGAYLPGYGVVFTFEVNLNPQPPALGPFGPERAAPSARDRAEEAKKHRQAALDMSERVLADFGHSLEQLGDDETIAIVIHGAAVGQQGIEKSTTVVRAQKRDIDQFRANTIDRAAFLRRLQVLEY
jgi:hypothetical protein